MNLLSTLRALAVLFVTLIANPVLAQQASPRPEAARPPGIVSISVCRVNGTGGQGSCPNGSFALASLMAAAQPLTAKYGEGEISGFVDDVGSNPRPYLYANSGDVRVARAQLNGGTAPLSFLKWNGPSFASPGLGGAEPSVLPAGSMLAAQNTGGDKRHRASNTAQPPDPLVAHKSPGRTKRSKHRRIKPDALTVKQKSKASNTPRQ